MGVRKMALKLRTTKKTIKRKIIVAAQMCDAFHRKSLTQWTRKPLFQMDEMETFEGMHGNTVKVPVIVEKDSHFIVDMTPLRDMSRSQYPRIKEHWNNMHHGEIQNKKNLFKVILNTCRKMKPEGRIVIDTDQHPTYPKLIKEAFGDLGVHVQYNAEDDKQYLFSVNNVIACVRQDVAATRKESWHISKSKQMLDARLKIYTFLSNYFKKKTYKIGKKRVEMTPAMHLGIFTQPIVEIY